MNDRIPPKRNCVALLSDFGRESFYVGVMKAVIHNAAPDAQVVDVTHDVTPYAVDEAGFVLRTVFSFFPVGTIFVAVVDPGVGGQRNNLIFRIEDRCLIAPDNGLVTDLSAAHRLDGCWKIEEGRIAPYRVHPGVGSTFLGRDVFAPAAGAIARGTPPEELGIPVDASVEKINVPPLVIEKNRIEAYGRYIDRFGNVLTDITGDHLVGLLGRSGFANGRVRIGTKVIEGVRRCYVDEPRGTLMAVLNSWNLVEISVSRGRADKALAISKAREMRLIIEA